ncbi:hypothetical protein [Cellulomonas sp. SG140]|uniref:hypothetical protein n=1 Tax=Cellulomonas sp. SG140 TaxID=2976536 RepID=UPI0021E96452|nr:hypothetical protein [Cellulomonas sp. SG140]
MLVGRTPIGIPSNGELREAEMPAWCSASSGPSWVLMVLAWAALVGLAVWTVCRLFPAQVRPDARTLLEERLATGELGVEQYLELKRVLDDGPRRAA